MNYKNTIVLGYEIFSDSLKKIDIPKNGKIVINTINPHSYVCANKDDLLQTALQDSDILLPDGIGMIYASKWLNKTTITRITGYDIFIQLLMKLNETNGKCFFMGTTNENLVKIKLKIDTEFTNLKVGYYAPPFAESFTKDENQKIIEEVNAFNPDVLFVGLSAPKQEKWVHKNKSKLSAKIFCSVGAVFDFYSGKVKRPNKFWRSIGLEWLVRFFKNPIKLWRRNILSLPIFITDVLKTKIINPPN